MGHISQSIIALFGGASQQAVSKSGDPKAWLKCHVRQDLLPYPEDLDKSLAKRALWASLQIKAKAMVAKVRAQEESLIPAKTGGRPAGRDPAAFARLMGVEYKDGMSLGDVYEAFILSIGNWLQKVLNETKAHFEVDLHDYLEDNGFPTWIGWRPRVSIFG